MEMQPPQQPEDQPVSPEIAIPLDQEAFQAAWDDPDLRAAASVESGSVDYEELLRFAYLKVAIDDFSRLPDPGPEDPYYQRVTRARKILTEYQRQRQERRQPPQQ